ncbi:hypothetical protein PCASD_23963 [Puccinia coronata f. sp. avenae]|uniref:AB hydrolase-1 domain-containing protein n=1 Tax=Puccinia coronata f. sp. avenae TaxID=200324 RepID=A0A2N5TPB4_9BASI|nr:hypothetical protein PCASD_23963 [Puccinia coronata f. sp. avenae]
MWIDRVSKPICGGNLTRWTHYRRSSQATAVRSTNCITTARIGLERVGGSRLYSGLKKEGRQEGFQIARLPFQVPTTRSFVAASGHFVEQGSTFSSSISIEPGGPIVLPSERFEPPSVRTSSGSQHDPLSPIIILHGLFGSKQNWRSLAKRLSQATGRIVYTLDLRNHGESQATPGFTSYLDYSSDIKHFIQTNSLKNVTLIGHSMGGKVAMTLALESSMDEKREHGFVIEKLVVVDISPAKGPISSSFLTYIDAFREINSSRVSSRKQADEILAKYEKDLGRRQFLLTNLKKVEKCAANVGGGSVTHEYVIRLPVEVLGEQLSSNQGAHSKYINKYNIPTIAAFFADHNHS